KLRNKTVLFCRRKKEQGEQRRGRNKLPVGHSYKLCNDFYKVNNPLVLFKNDTRLVKIANHCSFTFVYNAFIGLQRAGNQVKQGRFTTAVFAGNANSIAFFKNIAEIINKRLAMKRLIKMRHLHNFISLACGFYA